MGDYVTVLEARDRATAPSDRPPDGPHVDYPPVVALNEQIEHLVDQPRRDTDARVDDLEDGIGAVEAHANADAPARRRVLESVADEIVDTEANAKLARPAYQPKGTAGLPDP